MKKKVEEEVKTEEAPKKRGRKIMTPEDKEIAKKIKKVEQYAIDLGLTDVVIISGTKSSLTTQPAFDIIKDIKKELTALNTMIKKI